MIFWGTFFKHKNLTKYVELDLKIQLLIYNILVLEFLDYSNKKISDFEEESIEYKCRIIDVENISLWLEDR